MNSTYRLYATKQGEIPEGVEFSLRPCNTDYLLVFTDKELGKPFVEIPPETELTEQERSFVAMSKLEINRRHLEAHKDEYKDALAAFLDSLEEALESTKPQKKDGDKK